VVWVPVWVLGALAGCARSLPEVGSFGDSTAALAQTVNAAGDAAIAEVAELHDGQPASESAARALADQLAEHWKRRRVVMEGMTRYADALVSIVEAGQGGEQSARAVAESVNQLAGSVSSAFPAGHPLVKAITDGAAAVYKRIAIERAVRELDRAIAEADPVVQNVAELLVSDFAALRVIARQHRLLAMSRITMTRDIGTEFVKLNALEQGRRRLKAEVFDDNGVIREGSSIAAKLEQLGRTTELIEAERRTPWYETYLARKAEVERAYGAQAAVLEQGALVARAWARSHDELRRAVKDGRTPSFVELIRLTAELRQIYVDYRTGRAA
jgi:hypothetical protein